MAFVFFPFQSIHKPGIELDLSRILHLHTHASDSNKCWKLPSSQNHTSRIQE
jgi:hypothetical protein